MSDWSQKSHANMSFHANCQAVILRKAWSCLRSALMLQVLGNRWPGTSVCFLLSVQARLGCDGKIQSRWQANHSLRSAHFCISCQELRSCKCLQQQKSGSTEMYTVKKRPGGNDPFEHPEVCGVTLLSSSSNQRRAHETSEWSFILLILDHAEQISDFPLPQFLVSVFSHERTHSKQLLVWLAH